MQSIKLADEMQQRDLKDEQLALSRYYFTTAYACIRRLSRAGTNKTRV